MSKPLTWAFDSKFYKSPYTTLTDFSGHLPLKEINLIIWILKYLFEIILFSIINKIALWSIEFLSLSSSSDMFIVVYKRNTSFVTKNVFKIFFGFRNSQSSYGSSYFKSVFIMNSNIWRLSFNRFFSYFRFSWILFNHDNSFLKIYKILFYFYLN